MTDLIVRFSVHLIAIATAVLSALSVTARSTTRDESDQSEIEENQCKIQEVNEKLRLLEEKQELQKAEVDKKAKSSRITSTGKNSISLQSAKGDFSLQVRGLLQTDGRFYIGDDERKKNDDFLIRWVRIGFGGKFFRVFEWQILPEFAGAKPTLLNAWVDWAIDPAIHFQAGKVRLPIGLERYQVREDSLLAELGYPTSLVPSRDIGVNLHGQFHNGVLEYYIGAFNGTSDGGSTINDTDNGKSLAWRLFLSPLINKSAMAPSPIALTTRRGRSRFRIF